MNYLDEYIMDDVFEQSIKKIRNKQVLNTFDKYPHDFILEIGCGNDPIIKYRYTIKYYVGIDPSLKVGKLLPKMMIIPDIFEKESIQEYLKTMKFDLIILNSVLHIVKDYKKVLNLIKDLCKPKTVVHINIPNSNSIHRLLGVELGELKNINDKSQLDRKFDHKINMNLSELKEVVEEIGFSVISCGTYLIKPFSNKQMSTVANTPELLDALCKIIKIFPEFGCEMFMELRRK